MSAATRTEELVAQVQQLSTQVEELTLRLDQTSGISASGEESERALTFQSVEDWVVGLFLPLYSWRVDGQRWYWCERWWRHAEAIWRCELLWRSWEAARWQPTGMSAWSMELDHHLPQLLGDEGPFRQCRAAEGDRAARHVEGEVAYTQPAPPGSWPDPNHEQQQA